MNRHPFTIVASVILPDQMHFIWSLPPSSNDFSMQWRLIKSHFTRSWHPKGVISQSTSRQQKGEANVWQRCFCENLIRDATDLSRHVEYIHHKFVKHGLVSMLTQWKYSSFRKFVRYRFYTLDWV
jgi:putative transposase